MKDARHMCTNSDIIIGKNKNVMRCQLINQLFVVITLKVMGYGLNGGKDSFLGHRMDVYQVQLSLDDMCNPFITEWTY